MCVGLKHKRFWFLKFFFFLYKKILSTMKVVTSLNLKLGNYLKPRHNPNNFWCTRTSYSQIKLYCPFSCPANTVTSVEFFIVLCQCKLCTKKNWMFWKCHWIAKGKIKWKGINENYKTKQLSCIVKQKAIWTPSTKGVLVNPGSWHVCIYFWMPFDQFMIFVASLPILKLKSCQS